MSVIDSLKAELAKQLRVMVVDDERPILSAVRRELRGQQFEVQTFEDPYAALEALRHHEFALIISDNMMPGMMGLEFLAKAKSVSPATKRLLLTGKTDQRDAIKAFNEGVIHRFFEKPWDSIELLAIIQEDLEAYLLVKLDQRLDEIKTKTIHRRTSELEGIRRELADTRTELGLERVLHGEENFKVSGEIAAMAFLIVEPNPEVSRELSDALAAAGVKTVVQAKNGVEALHLINRQETVFDVVVSEWNLEKLSGLGLLRNIRENTALPIQPYFMFITGWANREAVEYAYAAKADGYLLKPYDLSRLIGQIEQMTQESGRPSRRYSVSSLKLLTVLVANQDATRRLFLQKCLGEVEVKKYLLADSGGKALKVLIKEPVDIILYDARIKDPVWSSVQQTLENIGAKSDQALIVTGYQEPDAPKAGESEEEASPDPMGPSQQLSEKADEPAPAASEEPRPQYILPPSFSQADFNAVLLKALEDMSQR